MAKKRAVSTKASRRTKKKASKKTQKKASRQGGRTGSGPTRTITTSAEDLVASIDLRQDLDDAFDELHHKTRALIRASKRRETIAASSVSDLETPLENVLECVKALAWSG